ncbi:MAG: ParG [Candidatus Sumerlaeota bacterium]|nr:ParG [Candidatus Sumerlaeota bacterium]
MSKKIKIGQKPTRLWEEEEGGATAKGPTKRLTFDVELDLHRRMKLDCTRRDVKMSDEIRQLLEERWPENAA